MKSKWYKKKLLNPSVIETIGIEQHIWEVISVKIHHDDLDNIATFLNVSKDVVTSMLFSPCPDPVGICRRIN